MITDSPNLLKKLGLFPGSSAVEQATVNRLAGGSNPSRGASPPSEKNLSFLSIIPTFSQSVSGFFMRCGDA